jgi:hypothetical protein
MALDDGFLDEVQQAARRLGPVAPTPDASAPGR